MSVSDQGRWKVFVGRPATERATGIEHIHTLINNIIVHIYVRAFMDVQ